MAATTVTSKFPQFQVTSVEANVLRIFPPPLPWNPEQADVTPHALKGAYLQAPLVNPGSPVTPSTGSRPCCPVRLNDIAA